MMSEITYIKHLRRQVTFSLFTTLLQFSLHLREFVAKLSYHKVQLPMLLEQSFIRATMIAVATIYEVVNDAKYYSM